jgi:hypothetical protein
MANTWASMLEDDDQYHEHKDAGIVHFDGARDTYDPDNDPGFVEVKHADGGGRIVYGTESGLTAEDRGTQQSIFDRLPLSQSNRSLFFNWLTTEYTQEQELLRRQEQGGDPIVLKKTLVTESAGTPNENKRRRL